MPTPVDAAVLTIARVSRVLELAAAPLSLADFRALSAIVEGEARASRLARRLTVGKPAISATVDSLARRGFVARGRADGDQRVVTLAATEEGRSAYGHALARMSARLGELTAATENAPTGIDWLGGLGAALDAERSRGAAS